MTNIENFWNWAEEELVRNNLTWHSVEKLAGLSNAAVSKRARDGLPPTDETCRAMAKAFNLTVVEVFYRAGILPPAPQATERWLRMGELWSGLSDEDQERLLGIAQTWRSQKME